MSAAGDLSDQDRVQGLDRSHGLCQGSRQIKKKNRRDRDWGWSQSGSTHHGLSRRLAEIAWGRQSGIIVGPTIAGSQSGAIRISFHRGNQGCSEYYEG